jgi:class 3 adenylate cyclase
MIATRRLAAILAADVAGYSRLMGSDEEGTLDSWIKGDARLSGKRPGHGGGLRPGHR